MRPFPILASAALLAATPILSACASMRQEDPPICDGRDRRPANPYGSILVSPSNAPAAAAAAPIRDPGNAERPGGCA